MDNNELIAYKEDMENKIQVIESVYKRNDNVYDKKTLLYCLNTLKRDRIKTEKTDD